MQKVILLSSARSGTNYFLDIFSKTVPNSLVLKEIFRKDGDNLDFLSELFKQPSDQIIKYFNEYPVDAWNDLINSISNETEYLVVKLFYYHIDNLSFFLHHISKDHIVVHLIRKNIFNTYISLQLALHTGKWQSIKKSNNDDIELIINRNELIKFIDYRTKEIWKIKNTNIFMNYFEIYYEDISKNSSSCITAISKILNTSTNINVPASLKKQKVKPNMEIIKNYSDIADLDKEIEFHH